MERVGEEARALWAEVYGSPPDGEPDAGALLKQLIAGLPPVGYDRFTTPELNDANLIWPVTAPRP